MRRGDKKASNQLIYVCTFTHLKPLHESFCVFFFFLRSLHADWGQLVRTTGDRKSLFALSFIIFQKIISVLLGAEDVSMQMARISVQRDSFK